MVNAGHLRGKYVLEKGIMRGFLLREKENDEKKKKKRTRLLILVGV